MSARAYIGLGSNLGDRLETLARAIEMIGDDERIEVVGRSTVYETEPVGPEQPAYLNQVVAVDTSRDADALLQLLLQTEYRLGRERGPERWGPRTIDLDLLLMGDQTIDRPGLCVPHRRLTERAFVLVPLVEVAGDAIHPGSGRPLAEHLTALRGSEAWGWVRPHRPGLERPDSMLTLDALEEVQLTCQAWRVRGRLGFVPTMGYLHQGHLSLIRQARAECDLVVSSIFVNPLQFGPEEDLDRYPRNWERDSALCRGAGVDLLFTTSPEQMYPEGYSTYVVEEQLGLTLCGSARPGHFRGVTTVVAKLFNLVAPHRAYFGRKDAQQAAIIERMTRDLNFPIEVRTLPIVREPDGLALSSRNAYLDGAQRQRALCLLAALRAAAEAFAAGERDAAALKAKMAAEIAPDGETVRIDYVEIVSRRTFRPAERVDAGDLAALAVHVGQTRLIDNLVFGERP